MKPSTVTNYSDAIDIFLNLISTATVMRRRKEEEEEEEAGLTLYLRQAPLLLLRVLSDPPQVLQLCLQELTLPRSLQPQVALLRKLRLQLADTPPQRLTQATTLEREGEKLCR